MEIYICDECAKYKQNIDVNLDLNLADFLKGIMAFEFSSENISITKELKCENCGMKFDEFKRTGKLGCGNCYETYSNKLEPIIKRFHGNLLHHGKTPGEKIKINEKEDLSKLKKLLLEAIEKEEYERAAEIRDKINDINL